MALRQLGWSGTNVSKPFSPPPIPRRIQATYGASPIAGPVRKPASAPSIKPPSPVQAESSKAAFCCCCQGAPGEPGDAGENGRIVRVIFAIRTGNRIPNLCRRGWIGRRAGCSRRDRTRWIGQFFFLRISLNSFRFCQPREHRKSHVICKHILLIFYFIIQTYFFANIFY